MERIRDYLFDSESDAWTLNAHMMAQKSAHVFAVLMFNLNEKDTKVQSLLSDPSLWLQEAVECDGVEVTTGLPLIHALFACHVSNEFALPGRFCELFDHWVRLEDGLLMMDAKDSGGRSLQPLAFANSNTSDWARSYGTYLKRFRIAEGPPVHESKTCAVHFGTDIETDGPVALKIMRVKEQYEREKDARDADGMAVDGCMSILYRDDAELAEALDKDFCLVMTQASRSLFEAINTERFAGRDLPKIRMIAYKVICVIQNLHNSGRIHGDIKPRNVVRVNASKQHTFKDGAKGGQFEVSKAWKDDSAGELFDAADEEDWQLIDLDASAEISSVEHPNERKLLTGKMSTGYVAPEVARWEFRDGTEGGVAPEAVPAIDVWGFGVVLFQLLSGTKLFMVDESDDNIIANNDKTELMNWLALDNERLHRIQKREDKNERKDKGKTGKSKADGLTATDFEIEAARDLVRLCLRGDPSERISVDQIVEHHPFFDVERLNARQPNKDQDDPNGDREDSNEDQDDANEDQDDEDQEDDVNEGQGNDSNEDQDYDSGNSPRRSNTQENPRFSERVMGLHRLVVPTRFSLFGRTTAPPLENDSHTSKFYAASAHNELIELPAYHFFLSHMQAQAAGTVKDLLMGLERNEMTAWVDMRASEITLKSMQRGVLSSQRFVMVLTTDVLFRPFCLAELKFAIDRFSRLEGGVTKYITFVVEGDSRFSAWDEDKNVPWSSSIKASDIEKLKEGLASLDLDPQEVLRDAENTVRECSKIPYRRRMYEEEAMLRALARHAGFRAVPLPPPQSSELRLCIVSKQSSPIANELKELLQDAGANLCKIEKAPVVLVVLEPKCQADVNAALDAAPANVPLLAVHHKWKFADDRKDLKPEWQTKLLDELEVLPWRAKTNKENATYLVDHEQPALISELCLRVRRALRASALDN
ncbi:Protein kinase, putative [Hondaea fermentalgiana]|uniref:Protein kinase, putative n=1 Tax=Hondaea fermentalgiana TaxID=2315210 RepID=A0A2R5G4Z2_9STRA|nr:Protein kinase, putative [Hondaea fermentalgiana]|eukprot:GBG24858.1 Protein kinase, putative [Hondaea fermentalgiana]